MLPSIISTVIVYGLIIYVVRRIAYGHQMRAAVEQEHHETHQDDAGHDTLRSRTSTAQTSSRTAEQERTERHIRTASSLVTEAFANRYILGVALVVVPVIAFILGGLLLGAPTAALCVVLAVVPFGARAWLNRLAARALATSGIASDEPLYVPSDWR